ncbi:hypothetical protein BT63DRAFT_419508 [Microthyrium microscopicum]|uniref:Sfi1 spindle body domain-containing protein n=1 Tax=Microthyrium microscopicum TaxID=703497 RepID=A0A6A6URV6_9PEZI|nr:hypothetical protein BT63DRAFT_419508 [Microthyrium microscopicum]
MVDLLPLLSDDELRLLLTTIALADVRLANKEEKWTETLLNSYDNAIAESSNQQLQASTKVVAWISEMAQRREGGQTPSKVYNDLCESHGQPAGLEGGEAEQLSIEELLKTPKYREAMKEAQNVRGDFYVLGLFEKQRRKQAQLDAAKEQARQVRQESALQTINMLVREKVVHEDNDRMYAEDLLINKFVNKMKEKANRLQELQKLSDEYKKQRAAEYVWNVLLKQKAKVDHLKKLSALVQDYHYAIEPFQKWRAKVREEQKQKLTEAYHEATELRKTNVMTFFFEIWRAKAARDQARLLQAQEEVKTIQIQGVLDILRKRKNTWEALQRLVPIAKEQGVLIHVEAFINKLRDNARRHAGLKQLSEQMRAEYRERETQQWIRDLFARKKAEREAREAEKDEETEDHTTIMPFTPARAQVSRPQVPQTPMTAPNLRSQPLAEFQTAPRTTIQSFRTPRRGYGSTINDPVFYQQLEEVMPDHALLANRPFKKAEKKEN